VGLENRLTVRALIEGSLEINILRAVPNFEQQNGGGGGGGEGCS